MEKKLTTNIEDKLIAARKAGLKEINSRQPLQALGKFKGMDTFCWSNPQMDLLISTLNTFPFRVIWVGHRMQIKCALKYYPESLDKVDSVIVYDDVKFTITNDAFHSLKNVVAVGDRESAFNLLGAFQEKNTALIFTTEGANASDDIAEFKQFLGY